MVIAGIHMAERFHHGG
jgi:hypothetical protein